MLNKDRFDRSLFPKSAGCMWSRKLNDTSKVKGTISLTLIRLKSTENWRVAVSEIRKA